MTIPRDSGLERTGDPDRIGQLVRLAGPRPAPDPGQVARARRAARYEWARVVERRKWRMPLWSLAAAAIVVGVLGAAGSLLHRRSTPAPGVEVATLQTVAGSVLITSGGEGPHTVNAPGTRLRTGDRLETAADGRAALLMPGGLPVRFDRATTAVLDSADRLILSRGAVYVDADPRVRAAFHIETSFGLVRHTGTQFEVRLDDSALTVRVREGSVAVEASGERWNSKAGEAVVVMRGRPIERRAIAISGPEWSWVSALAQPFHLEGATVPAFLEWVTREQGWRLAYADPSLRERVGRTVLHGSIEGLTPEEALAAVLPTCGLTSRLDGERLIVDAVRAK